jgi:predicted DNA-binding transcriptional regulator AlpA
MQTQTASETPTFLTGPQVQARYSKSHVSIWRWMNDPDLGFPKPVKINRLNYWKLSDLEAFEAAKMEAAA